MSVGGVLFVAFVVALALARVLHPPLRLRWLRRQLAAIDVLQSAEAEQAEREVHAEVDAIAHGLESGTLTETQAMALSRRQQAEAARKIQERHPVYLRRAQLQTEFWNRAPLRELDEGCRQREARLADPALSPVDRLALQSEIASIRHLRDLRAPEDWSRGGTIAVVVFFVFALALVAWRYRLFA